MNYTKLLVIASLVLLLTHCGKKDNIVDDVVKKTTSKKTISKDIPADDKVDSHVQESEETTPQNLSPTDTEQSSTTEEAPEDASSIPDNREQSSTTEEEEGAIATDDDKVFVQKNLSPTLRCLSGVYTARADLDNSPLGSLMTALLPDNILQLSIAHNGDSKMIVLVEELLIEEPLNKEETVYKVKVNPDSAVCSLWSNIEYNNEELKNHPDNKNYSILSAEVENIGSLYTVAGISNQIKFKEMNGEGEQISCQPKPVGFITLQNRQEAKQDSTSFVQKQNQVASYEYKDLMKKCIALLEKGL